MPFHGWSCFIIQTTGSRVIQGPAYTCDITSIVYRGDLSFIVIFISLANSAYWTIVHSPFLNLPSPARDLIAVIVFQALRVGIERHKIYCDTQDLVLSLNWQCIAHRYTEQPSVSGKYHLYLNNCTLSLYTNHCLQFTPILDIVKGNVQSRTTSSLLFKNRLRLFFVNLQMANYKSKVNFLQQHLADLLTQKKALHSRVVAEEFHKFKLTSSRVSLVLNVLLSMLNVVISAYRLVNTVIISISNSINCQNYLP